ncbi:coagulation factor VIII-like protein [Elysia marginata]|uniref:Coagulation factor VIII-like protein n=1 Tax=Elysia marginata TaxID=1093978 RepID=A0AAV4F9G1_9GAST|nr:coagulation factor VIII-like protein [Elysia marginata]
MINNHLEIDDARIQIDRAHRLRSNNGTGAIIVRITHYKDKENIMKNKKKLKDTNIHISDDYTPRIREIRRKLGPFLNKFRNEGKRATMVYDHLIVDGARLYWDPITGPVRTPLKTQHRASDRVPLGAPDRAPDRASSRAPDLIPDRITDRDQERTPSTQHSNRGVVQSSRATRGNAATTNE